MSATQTHSLIIFPKLALPKPRGSALKANIQARKTMSHPNGGKTRPQVVSLCELSLLSPNHCRNPIKNKFVICLLQVLTTSNQFLLPL